MLIGNTKIVITGRFIRTARVEDEWYNELDAPENFISELRRTNIRADLFTFLQGIPEKTPRYDFHLEWDSIAALPLTTYEHWWKAQINDKTRNMARKAGKKGVVVKATQFDDD